LAQSPPESKLKLQKQDPSCLVTKDHKDKDQTEQKEQQDLELARKAPVWRRVFDITLIVLLTIVIVFVLVWLFVGLR
jgi:lipopolysaccharide/colanic/teichoic acid biosynthesis glycosyltransferase